MSEETKDRLVRIRAARYKKIDEQLKVLADLKRYIFAALLAVVIGVFRTDEPLPFVAGVSVSVILLVILVVLVVVRYQQIEKYDE